MRLRNKPWAQDKLDAYPQFVPKNPEEFKAKWQSRFAQEQPIHIEVGSGKGQFIMGMAKAHPNINYIAIELQTSVIVTILEKQIEEQLPNVQILHGNGSELSAYFAPAEISLAYLNFSDPWPKSRHAKRRLTSPNFLGQFESVLPSNGQIHFKTDNQGLFEYSLESMSEYGMYFKNISLDLHKSKNEDNIMTEYEEKFSARGNRIYRLEAVFRK